MSTPEQKYAQYVEKVEIFKGLSPADVGQILEQGRTWRFDRGKTIFHQGSLGSNLFIVLKGEIGIYNKDDLIAKLHTGEAFGEMALLNKKPRSATAAALTDVKLFTLDEDQINKILERRVAVRVLLNIVHVLCERLEAANVRMR